MPFIKLSFKDCENILRIFDGYEDDELTESEIQTRETVRLIRSAQESKHEANKRLAERRPARRMTAEETAKVTE